MLIIIFLLPAIFAVYFGVQIHTVSSGSMRPTIHPGDVLITKLKSAEAIKKGEIILLFNNINQNVNSHRVVEVSRESDVVTFMTKGDANPLLDPKVANPSMMPIQTVAFVVPKIGFLFAATHSNYGIFLGGAGLLLMIIFFLITRLKKAKPEVSDIQDLPTITNT